jgi:hypothetical protein
VILRQAFHIFRKDVRGLRVEIAAVLAVMALFAHFHATASFQTLIERRQFYQLLLPASIWFLIGRVIQAEALPGNRQFWLTRPYSRVSLALAKLMFLALFVALPWALSDLAILHGQGFGFGHNAATFAWEQVLRFLFFVVTAAALAAVTGNMIQFVLGAVLFVAAGFGVYAAVVELASKIPGVAEANWIAGWLDLGVLGIICAVAIPWQYKVRRTWLSRAIVIPCIVLVVPGDVSPLGMAAAGIAPGIAEHGLNGAGVQIQLGAARQRDEQADQCSGAVLLRFPFIIEGLPEGTFVRIRVTGFGIADFSQAGTGAEETSLVTQGRAEFSHGLQMYCAEYRALDAAPARLHLAVEISVFHNPRNFDVPIGKQPFEIPEVGLCRRSDIVGWIDCLTAFHDVRVAVDRDYPAGGPDMFSPPSPFPADPSLSPLSWRRFNIQTQRLPRQQPDIEKVTTLEWLGGMGRSLKLEGIRLAGYAGAPLRLQ